MDRAFSLLGHRMQASQTPTLVPLAFAANGTKNVIPEASQISITPGAASLNDGFPPLTFTPIAAGGVPPAGADFNGVLNLITASIRWAHGGGTYGYNSTFANDANVGGYPRGALLLRSDKGGMWISQADNNTNNPDTGGANWAPAFMSGVVGAVRNLSMTVSAASASATLTADEIVVSTGLGGQKYVLSSINQTFNGATTGVNGMDTGSIPASSFLGLYEIYNPTTGAKGLLGQSANGVTLPNVYGGANMPAGYTASSLLCIVSTTAASLINICTVRDRKTSVALVSMFSTSTTSASPTIVNNLAVPLNAKICSGVMQIGNSATASVSMSLFGSVGGAGAQTLASTLNASSVATPFNNLELTVGQRAFYSASSSSGSPTFVASVSSWEI
ncbi:hypothetical protein [Paraburkholderia sp. RL17-373-BIF-A]|uniref:hypothetical protein n=1 Tax=Paraburkholderia sp. RL17-373-BIF-A TaxID=3031629 RepID=UPI0038B90F97